MYHILMKKLLINLFRLLIVFCIQFLKVLRGSLLQVLRRLVQSSIYVETKYQRISSKTFWVTGNWSTKGTLFFDFVFKPWSNQVRLIIMVHHVSTIYMLDAPHSQKNNQIFPWIWRWFLLRYFFKQGLRKGQSLKSK